MEILKQDVASNNIGIMDKFEQQVLEMSDLVALFESVRDDHSILAKRIYTQLNALTNKINKVKFSYQDENHIETSTEEHTGILRALCTKEHMSIDDGMSDLLSSQLHILSSSAKMSNIVNDLRSELSRISVNLERQIINTNKVVAAQDSYYDTLSKLGAVDTDNTKLDILDNNYRKLASEVDILKLELSTLKASSSPKPTSRISIRRPREVNFSTSIDVPIDVQKKLPTIGTSIDVLK